MICPICKGEMVIKLVSNGNIAIKQCIVCKRGELIPQTGAQENNDYRSRVSLLAEGRGIHGTA